ncbi:MAG: hypothetical protein HY731_12970 [Candidatus Tectomicrobia bacterium]|nr:hypothetical protein [Candidatus Tectomicrobia bacterium]
MKVKVTKVDQSDPYILATTQLIAVGESFVGELLEEPRRGISVVLNTGLKTTLASEVTPKDPPMKGWIVKTMNSIYDIEILEGDQA